MSLKQRPRLQHIPLLLAKFTMAMRQANLCSAMTAKSIPLIGGLTKSIADAEAKIEDLTTKIALEKKVAENQEALDQVAAIREKELAEFNAEEKDALQAISALKSAVTVLSKHHDSGLFRCLEAISRELQTPSNTRCKNTPWRSRVC